ncbi:DUF1905 domain-containing protein [Ancylomarina sp. 16SWW S1-10-2]|uniref:DUF1905 domain-containing protein n=1 Tax=Ancylomarina sp. 16SWW S1-10-2 TaxID=2499681 RepID=UPI0012AD5039|nr:DUF1905 domain-containing protein [Ancylomarina sp. 16SWW S1-10-2]MRT92813.1 DUF1905 domain-containing protein [Ancylomarina sp. 16SWW S1-10-2]
MKLNQKYLFSAKIYLIGINWCVDVPFEITNCLIVDRGRINIKGKINGFDFFKTLMPVKNATHRLFVNKIMMQGGRTALGKVAQFEIEQDHNKNVKEYSVPKLVTEQLVDNNLLADFNNLTASRKRSILKYFSFIKTEETLVKNTNKLISQLKNKEKNVKVP